MGGSTVSFTVEGATDAGVNAIRDTAGNTVQAGDITKSFVVPAIDSQGQGLGGSDWFEIQLSSSTLNNGVEVTATVYHKNACGYLTGDNRTRNATTYSAGAGTANVTFGGAAAPSDMTFSMDDGVGNECFLNDDCEEMEVCSNKRCVFVECKNNHQCKENYECQFFECVYVDPNLKWPNVQKMDTAAAIAR